MKGKVINCNICSKYFQNQVNLNIHIKTVHGHKVYKCESCDKAFSQAVNLKKHIHNVHEGNKDYKCESCGKSFSEGRKFKKHIQTDERCKFAFSILTTDDAKF